MKREQDGERAESRPENAGQGEAAEEQVMKKPCRRYRA